MATTDTSVTIAPWFKVHSGKMNEFKLICQQMVDNTLPEKGCHFYGFAFHEDMAFCREAYHNAEGALEHVGRVRELLEKALTLSSLERLELVGPESELAKLRVPLAGLNPVYYTLEYGFGVRL